MLKMMINMRTYWNQDLNYHFLRLLFLQPQFQLYFLPLEEVGRVLNMTDLRLGGGGGTTVFLFLGFSWICLLLPGVIEAIKWIKINIVLKRDKSK